MPRQLFLGIDIGTQSTRVALVNPLGQIVASHSRAYNLHIPRPGWAEQDPETWWGAVLEGIRAVLDSAQITAGEILAVGCDAQMHATIPLLKDGSLGSHGVQLWCDKRGSDLVDELSQDPFVESAARLAGSPPVAAWIGFKILWLKRNQPELYAQTWKFLTGSGFIDYRLTGQLSIDWSEASGAFLMDAEKLAWSPELADFLGVDLAKVPPIFRSQEVVGRITPEAAHLTGLPEGIPVVAGGGDMLVMLFAAGLIEKGRAMDVSGTASNLVFFVDRPVLHPPVMNLHHSLDGWCPFGIVETGGGSLRWFTQVLYETGAANEDNRLYEIMNQQAVQIPPGCDGLLYLPYLQGERVLGTPNARGAFIGLNLNTRPETMYRAILEGVTFELRRTLEIVRQAGNPIQQVNTTGGGARSDLWSQIKADIYQVPVYTLAEDEGGVVGSAMLGMLASGYYPDPPSAAAACVKVARCFQPNADNAERYTALFELFKDIHDRLQAPFDRLAEI